MLATLDEFESGEVLDQAQKLARVIEKGLCRLAELDLVAQVRGEGVVWGVELGPIGKHSAGEVAAACVQAVTSAIDAAGRSTCLAPWRAKSSASARRW